MGFINLCGKVARGAAKCIGKTIEIVGGKVIGKPIEWALKGVGEVIGLGNERLGGVVTDAGTVVGHSLESGSKIASQTIQQTANIATWTASLLVGDGEGEMDAESDCNKAWDDFTDHFSKLLEAAKDATSGFTGKSCYDSAKYHYECLNREKTKKQEAVNREIDKWTEQVQQQLSMINDNRRKANALFRKFEQLSSVFTEWQVRNRVLVEQFQPKHYSFEKMQSHEDVFKKIDFDNSPFWNNLKGVLTAGFLTESQSKDAEVTICGVANAFKEESQKADNKINDYKKITEALTFVQTNFDFFLNFYQSMLHELSYSVHLLRESRYLWDIFHFSNDNEKLDPYFLPERHLRCLLACDKLSRLLCDLSNRQYFSDSEVQILSVDYRRVEKYRDRVIIPLTKEFAA